MSRYRLSRTSLRKYLSPPRTHISLAFMSMNDGEFADGPVHLDLRHAYDRMMADFGDSDSDLPLAKKFSEMSDARTFLGEMGAAEEMKKAINHSIHIPSRGDNIAFCRELYPPEETVPENLGDGHQDEAPGPDNETNNGEKLGEGRQDGAPEPGAQFGRVI